MATTHLKVFAGWTSLALAAISALEIMQKSSMREEQNIDLRHKYTYQQHVNSTAFGKEDNYVEEVYWIGDTQYRKRDGKIKKRTETPDDRKKQKELRLKVPEAFTFKLIGEEQVNGRDCYRIEAEPKPGFKELSSVRGTLWVDKLDFEWAKIDAELVAPLSAKLGFFKAEKGTHFNLEQARVNNEVWFPLKLSVHAGGRAAYFFKGNS